MEVREVCDAHTERRLRGTCRARAAAVSYRLAHDVPSVRHPSERGLRPGGRACCAGAWRCHDGRGAFVVVAPKLVSWPRKGRQRPTSACTSSPRTPVSGSASGSRSEGTSAVGTRGKPRRTSSSRRAARVVGAPGTARARLRRIHQLEAGHDAVGVRRARDLERRDGARRGRGCRRRRRGLGRRRCRNVLVARQDPDESRDDRTRDLPPLHPASVHRGMDPVVRVSSD